MPKGPTRGPGSRPAPRAPAPAKPRAYGLIELAELVGYDATNRARLRRYLPPPDFELRMGPVWLAATIEPWLQHTPLVDMRGP